VFVCLFAWLFSLLVVFGCVCLVAGPAVHAGAAWGCVV